MNFYEPISGLIERIARALERLGPRPIDTPDFDSGDAFVWHADSEAFQPVREVNRLPLGLLKGWSRSIARIFPPYRACWRISVKRRSTASSCSATTFPSRRAIPR
jgi:hypothetical protein